MKSINQTGKEINQTGDEINQTGRNHFGRKSNREVRNQFGRIWRFSRPFGVLTATRFEAIMPASTMMGD